MTFSFGLILVCLAGLGIAYGKYLRQELYRMRSHNTWSANFRSLSIRLIKDDAVLPCLIHDVRIINRLSDKPNSAKSLYRVLDRRNRLKYEIYEEYVDLEKNIVGFLHEYDKERLATLYNDAMHAGFLLLSYTNLFWGIKARALIAELFSPDFNPALITKIEKEEEFGDARRGANNTVFHC